LDIYAKILAVKYKSEFLNMKIVKIWLLGVAALILAACATTQDTSSPGTGTTPYTQGNVTMTLKKGITTQEQVANAFGAPNIVTQDTDGNQVWIYQKDNVSVQSGGSSGYFTILVAGGNTGSGGYQQSNRTMTLIIKFDKRGIVKEFKSMSTSF
jgi:outer membrane protein assembly factor BamE (lipoprotein component of BamABCDE complex)